MKNVYQLWGIAPASPDWALMLRRFERLQRSSPAHAVICGLDAPRDVYAKVREAAHSTGTKVYLWLPVFSEFDHLTSYDPLVDFEGQEFLKNHTGGFRFRCPNSEKNLNAFLCEAQRRLSQGEFDGVFLDRIRYPSFQYGLSGVLGCFCAECRKRYGEGTDVLEACRQLKQRCGRGEPDPLGLKDFDGSRYTLSDPGLQTLFDARCDVITRQMEKICAHFRARGLSVGLDLFTPAIAYFAGQDFAALCALADFVKPMLYLQTDAPAGLPYEIRMMDEALGRKGVNDAMRLLGENDLQALVRGEVNRMAQVKKHKGFAADILCGMEYNRVLPITPASPETVFSDATMLRLAGAEGITASWNLFFAPEENVDALLKALA